MRERQLHVLRFEDPSGLSISFILKEYAISRYRPVPAPVYRPRNPKQTPYYRSVEDQLETLEQVYEDRFERISGFFCPHVKQVMERYLDCGNLLKGKIRTSKY